MTLTRGMQELPARAIERRQAKVCQIDLSIQPDDGLLHLRCIYVYISRRIFIHRLRRLPSCLLDDSPKLMKRDTAVVVFISLCDENTSRVGVKLRKSLHQLLLIDGSILIGVEPFEQSDCLFFQGGGVGILGEGVEKTYDDPILRCHICTAAIAFQADVPVQDPARPVQGGQPLPNLALFSLSVLFIKTHLLSKLVKFFWCSRANRAFFPSYPVTLPLSLWFPERTDVISPEFP